MDNKMLEHGEGENPRSHQALREKGEELPALLRLGMMDARPLCKSGAKHKRVADRLHTGTLARRRLSNDPEPAEMLLQRVG